MHINRQPPVQPTPTLQAYAQVRRVLIFHGIGLVLVNSILWAVWLLGGDSIRGDVPWPLAITLGWLLIAGLQYRRYLALRRAVAAENIPDSVAQAESPEMARLRANARAYEERTQGKVAYSTYVIPSVRMTEEGDLTDSYVRQVYSDLKRPEDAPDAGDED